MSVRIGKIRGIDIKLNNSWVLIFFIITWSLATTYLPSQYPSKSDTFYFKRYGDYDGETDVLTWYE